MLYQGKVFACGKIYAFRKISLLAEKLRCQWKTSLRMEKDHDRTKDSRKHVAWRDLKYSWAKSIEQLLNLNNLFQIEIFLYFCIHFPV